jgi:arginine/ornithine N-succinyltransferase beta subunit
MGILKKLFPFRGETPCSPCKEKMEALKEEHRRARQRIERMEASLEAASMNGEERWFLTLQKSKEDCNHG